MSRGPARPDKNGLTPQRFWAWVQSKYPVFGLLTEVGIVFYPKYDAGPKTGDGAVERETWDLGRLHPVAPRWCRATGPRVGGREAQFPSMREAVKATLTDLGLRPRDFVLPPLQSKGVYPKRSEIAEIRKLARKRRGGQKQAEIPRALMQDPRNAASLVELVTRTSFADLRRRHGIERLGSGDAAHARRAAFEKDVCKAFAAFKEPISSLIDDPDDELPTTTGVGDDPTPVEEVPTVTRLQIAPEAAPTSVEQVEQELSRRIRDIEGAYRRSERDASDHEARAVELRQKAAELQGMLKVLRGLQEQAKDDVSNAWLDRSLDHMRELLDDAVANETAPVHKKR